MTFLKLIDEQVKRDSLFFSLDDLGVVSLSWRMQTYWWLPVVAQTSHNGRIHVTNIKKANTAMWG